MEEFLETLNADDANVEVTNAFAYSMDEIFTVITANSAEEELAGAILCRINLREKQPTYEVLHDLNVRALDYLAQSPDRHYVLAMGAYLHEWIDGAFKYYDYPEALFLPNLADVDGTSLVVFGAQGRVFKFHDGHYDRLQTTTQEELKAGHFLNHDNGFVGGNFGSLLRWNGRDFAPVDLGNTVFIKGLHTKQDGSVMLACEDGIGMLFNGDEIVELNTAGSELLSVTEFKGVEYWGDDDFGVMTREGGEFVPKFETGYAFRMNATEKILQLMPDMTSIFSTDRIGSGSRSAKQQMI